MVYWLVSIPAPPEEGDGCWSSLQEDTTYQADLSVNFHFKVPDFRVGTLDSLLGLSDDLVKVNSSVEGTVNKIRRQLFELQSSAVSPSGEEAEETGPSGVTVEGTSPTDYLQHFEWQEAKYPVKRALKHTLHAITEVIQALDDDLKVWFGWKEALWWLRDSMAVLVRTTAQHIYAMHVPASCISFITPTTAAYDGVQSAEDAAAGNTAQADWLVGGSRSF